MRLQQRTTTVDDGLVLISVHTLALGRPSFHRPVAVSALYIAWLQWSGADNGYSRTFPQCACLEEQQKMQSHLDLAFDEPVVWQAVWKLRAHVVTDVTEIERLEVAVAHGKSTRIVITSLSDMRHGRLRRRLPDVSSVCFFSLGAKYLQNSSRIQKISIIFAPVMWNEYFLCNLLIVNYKDTKKISFPQLFQSFLYRFT